MLKRVLNKLRLILSKHQKVRIIELGIIMIIGGFIEMFSVSLIIPFMNAVMNPDTIMTNHYILFFCDLFNIRSNRILLVYLALVMAGIYILKNVFLLFQMMVQNRFVYSNMFNTQLELLHNYLLRPYDYYLSVKSGEVLRVISNDTTSAFNLLTTVLQVFSELTVSVALIATIFIVTPGVTIGIAAILSVMVFIIQIIIRPVLRTAGEKNRKSQAEMNQWLLQAIQGIKEVKISRKENYFEKSYSRNGQVYTKTSYQNSVLGLVPRFMIEAIAMSAFFIMLAFLIYQGLELEKIVPLLSAVAMAAIRTLPSINRITQGMSAIAYYEPALDKMIEDLRELVFYDSQAAMENKNDGKRIQHLNSEIKLENITYRYPQGEGNVLKNATMAIHKGESIGIVGQSGAGKTTVVDILLGLLKPNKGKVYIDGTDIELDMGGWLDQIGYIPQTIFMLDGSVRENVAFGIPQTEINEDMVWKALEEAAIAKDVRNFPDGLDTQLGERGIRLSGGQRQRIGIARALYAQPSVLVCDEATSALDNETEKEIMDAIDQLHGKKTMIIIAHRLTTIEKCDVVFKVENGNITQVIPVSQMICQRSSDITKEEANYLANKYAHEYK